MVSLQLAMRLQKLRHLTPAEAAVQLRVPEDEIREACRMLQLTLRDDDTQHSPAAVSVAIRTPYEPSPKWQDRTRKKDDRR